ncbi:MAG: acetylglutamate kinase [Rickettsiales bacterium]|nr:acetylglutamate kinase [Rickettsiales bacterium]|tara:strand:+ start:1990 stop:2469 length:480 start_codon:yes stop_codon:yes gene_type:complete
MTARIAKCEAGSTDKKRKTSTNRIVMNFTTPPSADDLEALSEEILEFIPHDLKKYLGDFTLQVEDFADIDVEDEFDLESPYDLLCYYKSLHTPTLNGVSSVGKGDADILYLYRRPLLDLWAECEDDLTELLKRTLVEELGQHCGFEDHEIDEFIDDMME